MKIFSGTANLILAKEVAKYLGRKLSDISIKRFPDCEIWVKINENVRGKDVFIIQSTSNPVNEHIMELFIMLDAFKRASARRITAVLPFYSYARQDRKDQPRVAVTAKLMANLLTSAGADRILTMDLHAPQVQGFFDIPVDHLLAEPVITKYFLKKKIKNLAVVATDMGGVKIARTFAQKLGCNLAIVDKRRSGPHEVKAMNLIGDVKDKDIVMPDDMISTGGTMVEAAYFLKEKGAREIYACCTHPILCGGAVEKLNKAPVREVIVTNTIPLSKEQMSDKIKILSIAPLFAEAIKSIHNETSISRLFN
ncbi:MAG: ribose-phosphate pyrophosphokinase [Candidatus Firestonebacteria bacterium]